MHNGKPAALTYIPKFYFKPAYIPKIWLKKTFMRPLPITPLRIHFRKLKDFNNDPKHRGNANKLKTRFNKFKQDRAGDEKYENPKYKAREKAREAEAEKNLQDQLASLDNEDKKAKENLKKKEKERDAELKKSKEDAKREAENREEKERKNKES